MGKKQKAKRIAAARNPPPAKTGPYVPKDGNDLFSNPMTKAAMAALSDDQKRKYAIIGEELYGHINFENGQVLNNMPPPMAEAVAYLETQIDAGLHISMLEDNEKLIMKDAYGENWYEKWSCVKEDLDDIVTLNPQRKKNVGDK